MGRGTTDSRKDSSLAHSQDPVIARAILKRGREGPVRGGNPWIFSQAIERIEPSSVEAGGLVTVHRAPGALLGVGYCKSATTIAVPSVAGGGAPPNAELGARRVESARAPAKPVL